MKNIYSKIKNGNATNYQHDEYVNVLFRSNFTVLTIALHEGLPGHHLQVSYMRNLALPDFRRYFDAIKKYAVPFSFPYYTAYVEVSVQKVF